MPDSDSTAEMLNLLGKLMRRGATWPIDLLGLGKVPHATVPFPDSPTGGGPTAPEDLESTHARRFLSLLGHVNDISDANSKIAHALLTLWLTRLPVLGADPAVNKAALDRRKEALSDLLHAYQTLSREYIHFNLQILRALMQAGR